MSRTPMFFVERYNARTDTYELQHPYVWNYAHTEMEPASLYPYNGDHELFSIVENTGTYDFPEMNGIHVGLPKDCCEEIRKEFNEDSSDYEGYNGEIHHYAPKVRWFSYADMYIYYLEHPEVKDWDEEDATVMKPTPIKGLKDRVDAFLEVWDGWDWKNDYCQIRIVYWIE